MKTENKRLIGILAAVAVLLTIPFIAGLFGGMNWSKFDFLAAGVLLLGTGLIIELVLRLVKTTALTAFRLVICGAVLLALLAVWVEIAVGVFGTRFAGS